MRKGRWTKGEDADLLRWREQGVTLAEIDRRMNRKPGSANSRLQWMKIADERERKEAARPPPRDCLRCHKSFHPDHRLNFVCTDCTQSDDWRDGNWTF